MEKIISNLFSKSECDKIISYATEAGLKRQRKMENRNTSFDSVYVNPDDKNAWIFNKIYYYFEMELDMKIVLPLDKIMVNHYLIGDSFDMHRDLYFKKQIYTMMINLSIEYEGGEFELFEPYLHIQKGIGSGCLFDNNRLHGVTKITNGDRWTMLAFFLIDNFYSKNKLI